jgi:hypothetical protein
MHAEDRANPVKEPHTFSIVFIALSLIFSGHCFLAEVLGEKPSAPMTYESFPGRISDSLPAAADSIAATAFVDDEKPKLDRVTFSKRMPEASC